jgi:hypothetical protein
VSWHGQLLYNGDYIVPDFAEAWRLSADAQSCLDVARPGGRIPDYRNEAQFAPKLKRFFDVFPAEQVRVFHFDDWTRDPRAIYLEILDFLGLEDDGRVDFPPVNEARHHRTGIMTKLVRNPPVLVRRSVHLLRKLTGRRGLGLANLALRLDSRKGPKEPVAPEVKEEIRAYFREDACEIEQWLWKPASKGR